MSALCNHIVEHEVVFLNDNVRFFEISLLVCKAQVFQKTP